MFHRRKFLAGLSLGAAGSLFLPLIRSLSASDTSGQMPRRFVFVVQGNGLEPVNVLSQAARAHLSSQNIDLGTKRVFSNHYDFSSPQVIMNSGLSSARVLSPLQSLEQKSAVLLGLSNQAGMSDAHSSRYGALSCARGTTSPTAPSIDSILAGIEHVRGETPFDVFRAGIHDNMNAQTRAGLCAYESGKPAPVIVNPYVSYNTLFSSVAGGDAAKRFDKQRRLLDFARTSTTNALGVYNGNSLERRRLEDYISSIEEIQMRNAELSSADFRQKLSAVKPPGPEDEAPAGTPSFTTSVPLERLQLHFDMATAALLGGLTNVSVLGAGFGGGFNIDYTSIRLSGLDLERGHHPISHSAYDNANGGLTTDNPYAEYIRVFSEHIVTMVAKLANRLEATPDVDGSSMLDNTLIVFMSDNGDNHHSGGNDWPLLLVGGKNMGFQTDGRTVIYPQHKDANARQLSNFFNTVGHAAGGADIPLGGGTTRRLFDYFGADPDDKRNAAGPLSEFWQTA